MIVKTAIILEVIFITTNINIFHQAGVLSLLLSVLFGFLSFFISIYAVFLEEFFVFLAVEIIVNILILFFLLAQELSDESIRSLSHENLLSQRIVVLNFRLIFENSVLIFDVLDNV